MQKAIINKVIPYTYKFKRDVIFADDRNPGFSPFSRIICNQPLNSLCIVIILKNFIFMDDKLATCENYFPRTFVCIQ